MAIDWEAYRKKAKKRDEYEYQKNIANNDIAPIRTTTTLTGDDIAPPVKTGLSFKDAIGIANEYKKKNSVIGTDFFKKPESFDDKEKAKSVGKAILGTGADFSLNVLTGVGNFAEGIGDTINYGIADISEKVGNKGFADALREETKKNVVQQLLGETTETVDKWSVLDKTSDSVAQGLGMITTLGAGGMALGGAGVGVAGQTAVTTGGTLFSGIGSGMSEAYEGGATDEEARTYGLISGTAEALSEMLFGGLGKGLNSVGLGKGLSSADDMLAKKVSNMFSSQITKNLAEYGIKAGAEGFEEVLAGVAQAIGKKMTYMSEKDFLEILKEENLLEQFIVGSVTSGFAQVGDFYTSAKTGTDFISGLTENEQKVVDKEVENRIAEREEKGKKVTNKDKSKIYDKVVADLDKGYISIDTIESALGGEAYNNYKSIAEQEDSLQNEFDTLNKMKQGDMTGEQIDKRAELKQQLEELKKNSKKTELKDKLSNDVFNLAKDSRLAESYNEKARRGLDFEADLSKYDTKQQEVIKKAVESGILNNTNRTHEFVDMIAKISADKGVLFDFTNNEKLKNSGFALEGKTVNGYKTEDGNIALNMQSQKALESVVGHEITHILEGTELYSALQEAVKQYATTKGEYAERMQSLRELYTGVYKGEDFDTKLQAELTADIVGDYLFSDSDFINSLSTEQPNLFKKIYNEIKYLCKVATAGSKEARELEKVRKAFDNAWKESGKTQKNTTDKGDVKYSITEPFVDGNGNQYDNAVLLDTDFFDGLSPRNWGNKLKSFVERRSIENPFIMSIVDEMGNKQQLQFANVSDRVTKDGASEHKVLDKLSASSDNLSKLAVIHIDEIVSVSEENNPYYSDSHNHKWLDEKGWLHRNANVINKKNGSIYNLTIDIAKTADGRTILYATDGKIKKVGNVQVNSLKIKGPGQNSNSDEILPQNSEKSIENADFSLSDSNGKELSTEQSEYFKESKIRDADGNLKVMYHGSPETFTVFDKKKARSSGTYGNGFYFTDSKSHAGTYGDSYEVYLNITNPLQNGTNDITKEQLRKFVEEIAENEDYGIENYGYGATIDSVVDSVYGKSDFGMILDLNISCIGNMVEAVELFNKVNGTDYDGIVAPTETVAFYPNQIKKIDNKAPTSNSDIRFSLSEQVDVAPTFYSQMGRVVDTVKQEKLGAASVIPMLKGKGIKNEEIKWSGIEEFLEGKKSVTKAELQEFIANNQLDIETETLSEDIEVELEKDGDNYIATTDSGSTTWYYTESGEWFNEDFGLTAMSEEDIVDVTREGLLAYDYDGTHWHEYKLSGGSNYRELLFKMPNSNYSNDAMYNHWKGIKGVLAHARIQDFTDAEGKKVLFIEEIQSDWHNQGQKKGYVDKRGLTKLSEEQDEVQRRRKELTDELIEMHNSNAELVKLRKELYETQHRTGLFSEETIAIKRKINEIEQGLGIAQKQKDIDLLIEKDVELSKKIRKAEQGSPDAPFRDNYHEYVLKRLLRMAAEEGYDSIGWTTADIQSERWSNEYAEGYRIEYDQDIPKFLNKYGKKWGAKVSKSQIDTGIVSEFDREMAAKGYIDIEPNYTDVWSIDITDSMKESVLYEGQPLYSLSKEGEQPTKNGRFYGKDMLLDLPVRKDIAKNATTTFDDIAPMTEAEAKAMRNDVPLTDADVPPEIDAPMYDAADTTKIDDTTLKGISQRLRETLSLTTRETKAIEGVVQKYSTTGLPDKTKIFDDIKEEFGEKRWKEYNEEIAEVKRTLKGFKIKVSDKIKSDISDYSDWKKRHQGRLNFSEDGLTVDDIYMGLSISYPGLFPEEIINPTDQLLRMAELAENDIYSTASQEVDNDTIQQATDIIFSEVNKYKENELSQHLAEEQSHFYKSLAEETTENQHIQTVKERLNAKLENVRKELLMNQQLKDDSISDFEKEITRLQAEYNAKKDKNTKVANDILRRIERLQTLKGNVEADYSKRISDLKEKRERLTKEMLTGESPTEQGAMRRELHESIIKNIKNRFEEKGFRFDDVFRYAKNLSTFATVDNTPQRVMEKALGYKQGQILADETVNKVAQNESEGIKWLNSFTDKKKGLLAQISKEYHIKPGSKKSAAAQMYAEGFYVDENNDIVFYGDKELEIDFPDATVRQNIKGLANDPRIRQIYDETLDAINESRIRNAYPEIKKLDNYFLHFRAMEDTFSRLGLPFNPNDIKAKDLPTDLNGVTADLKPGQPYFASAKHRMGKRTSFDLLGGLERYLSSAKNQIYHIDDIQTLRALRNYIANTYGQAHALDDIDGLTEAEVQERLKEVYNSHLSTFAKFLNEEANVIAGKTALIDRGLEGIIGRRGIQLLDTVNKQVGSNMVGFNISSSLTNFLSVAQSLAKNSKRDSLTAFTQMASNKIGSLFGKSDGFAESNPGIVRRKGAEKFAGTPYEKVKDAGYLLASAVDDISTEFIVRTKFNEFTRKGMSEEQAHIEADKWASRLLGDRSLGQQPQLYNSKMLGLFTKFQLEVRNQLDTQFYDTIQEAKVSNEEIENALARNAKTAAKVGSTFLQLALLQHAFGKAFESVAGYNPAFDIIDVLIKTFGFDDDEEDEDTPLDNLEQGFLALLEDLPYTSTLTGGRIPISSALPIKELVTGEDDYGTEKSRVETLKETIPYYLLPGGYGQIKKTAQGLKMFDDDLPIAGSYTDSGNLRFPVEDTPLNIVQAGLFGQYANENARKYFDDDIAPLNEKQIKEYADLDLPIADYWKYRERLKDFEKQDEKVTYINGLDVIEEQKNTLKSYLFDEEGYKEDDPEKYAFLESEGIGFLGYKEADDETQNAWSWAFKHQDEYRYLKENGVNPEDYSVYYSPRVEFDDEDNKAYSWAFDNPEKATIGKVFGNGVKEYRQYTSALSELKSDKDSKGNSISGSLKKKKAAYINSLDIDMGAKYVLYKSQYPKDNTYNKAIFEYINGRSDITYDEKKTILEELGATVDSNGNVRW